MAVRDIPERPHGAPAESWQFMSWVDLLWRRFCDDVRFVPVVFTRDMSTASSTQSVTGFGFSPRFVEVEATGSLQAGAMSWGCSDGTTNHVIYDNGVSAADTYNANSSAAILVQTAVGSFYSGTITLTPDGIDVAWTRTGTPTGTMTVNARGFR